MIIMTIWTFINFFYSIVKIKRTRMLTGIFSIMKNLFANGKQLRQRGHS